MKTSSAVVGFDCIIPAVSPADPESERTLGQTSKWLVHDVSNRRNGCCGNSAGA
jgi:hypothetical protein